MSFFQSGCGTHQGFGAKKNTGLAIPLDCYRIGFGSLARNRKNRFRPFQGLPRKIRKKGPKNWKIGAKIGFCGHFPFLGAIFSYFPGEGLERLKAIFSYSVAGQRDLQHWTDNDDITSTENCFLSDPCHFRIILGKSWSA